MFNLSNKICIIFTRLYRSINILNIKNLMNEFARQSHSDNSTTNNNWFCEKHALAHTSYYLDCFECFAILFLWCSLQNTTSNGNFVATAFFRLKMIFRMHSLKLFIKSPKIDRWKNTLASMHTHINSYSLHK